MMVLLQNTGGKTREEALLMLQGMLTQKLPSGTENPIARKIADTHKNYTDAFPQHEVTDVGIANNFDVTNNGNSVRVVTEHGHLAMLDLGTYEIVFLDEEEEESSVVDQINKYINSGEKNEG